MTKDFILFQPNNGLLFYLELLDMDTINSDDLIDRFAIKLSLPFNALNVTQFGVFKVATLDVSIIVTCQTGFIGEVCNVNIIWAVVAPIVIIGLIIAALPVVCMILVKCKKRHISPSSESYYSTLVSLMLAIILFKCIFELEKGQETSNFNLLLQDSDYHALQHDVLPPPTTNRVSIAITHQQHTFQIDSA